MLLQPAPGERTVRHDRQVLAPRPVQRGPDEDTTEAASAQLLGHLGVDEHEPVAVEVVDELGGVAVLDEDEALLVGVVFDGAQRTRTIVSTSPEPNAHAGRTGVPVVVSTWVAGKPSTTT